MRKSVIIVTLTVVASLALASFSLRFIDLKEKEEKLANLEESLVELKTAVHPDAKRHNALQKVIGIIERYNPKMAHETRYSIAETVFEMEQRYHELDLDLILAVITYETAYMWRPDMISRSGAMGLMQLMPANAMLLASAEHITWAGKEKTLLNPVYNIRLACRYLDQLIALYGLEGGLAAYRGGEERAAAWLQHGKNPALLWQHTRGYVPSVLNLYNQFTN